MYEAHLFNFLSKEGKAGLFGQIAHYLFTFNFHLWLFLCLQLSVQMQPVFASSFLPLPPHPLMIIISLVYVKCIGWLVVCID